MNQNFSNANNNWQNNGYIRQSSDYKVSTVTNNNVQNNNAMNMNANINNMGGGCVGNMGSVTQTNMFQSMPGMNMGMMGMNMPGMNMNMGMNMPGMNMGMGGMGNGKRGKKKKTNFYPNGGFSIEEDSSDEYDDFGGGYMGWMGGMPNMGQQMNVNMGGGMMQNQMMQNQMMQNQRGMQNNMNQNFQQNPNMNNNQYNNPNRNGFNNGMNPNMTPNPSMNQMTQGMANMNMRSNTPGQPNSANLMNNNANGQNFTPNSAGEGQTPYQTTSNTAKPQTAADLGQVHQPNINRFQGQISVPNAQPDEKGTRPVYFGSFFSVKDRNAKEVLQLAYEIETAANDQIENVAFFCERDLNVNPNGATCDDLDRLMYEINNLDVHTTGGVFLLISAHGVVDGSGNLHLRMTDGCSYNIEDFLDSISGKPFPITVILNTPLALNYTPKDTGKESILVVYGSNSGKQGKADTLFIEHVESYVSTGLLKDATVWAKKAKSTLARADVTIDYSPGLTEEVIRGKYKGRAHLGVGLSTNRKAAANYGKAIDIDTVSSPRKKKDLPDLPTIKKSKDVELLLLYCGLGADHVGTFKKEGIEWNDLFDADFGATCKEFGLPGFRLKKLLKTIKTLK